MRLFRCIFPILVIVGLAAGPAQAVTQAVVRQQLGTVLSRRGFTGLDLQLVLKHMALPKLYLTAAELAAAAPDEGSIGYALDTHAIYFYTGSSWSQIALSAAGNATVGGTLTITGVTYPNGGIDRSTAAGLAIGAANATGVTITPITTVTGALYANGGVDRSTAATLTLGGANATTVTITPQTTITGGVLTNAVDRITGGALAIGGSTATSVTITPITTVTGALYTNGGVDRSTAAALAIGAANATGVTITPATTVTGAFYPNGGIDRSTAATLAIGAANATGVTVTPATTVVAALYPDGGVDRSTAAALAIGATNATSVVITPPMRFRRTMLPKTDNYTMVFATDCGGQITIGVDNKTITLPLITSGSSGCELTISNTATATNALITVAPNASDGIAGSCGAVALDGAANKGILNTKGTQAKGDSITVISTGTSGAGGWLVNSCTGIWARAT